MMNGHFLILGGARSGKTALGERLALKLGSDPAYLATAEALDEEMRERVAVHRNQRAGRFTTIEEPLDLPEALGEAVAAGHDVILVDCLTLWISNLLGSARDVSAAADKLVTTLREVESARIILISNEVGLGIVPDNALARSFRDLTGWTHQQLGAVCGNVVFVAAGLPLTMKGSLPDLD